jgi:hypothetical protein
MKLDLSHSWIVGDQASDILAGRAAKLAGGLLLSPSEDDPERIAATALKAKKFVVHISGSLEEAVSLLLSRGFPEVGARRGRSPHCSTTGSRSK